jgi:hypothetical protein
MVNPILLNNPTTKFFITYSTETCFMVEIVSKKPRHNDTHIRSNHFILMEVDDRLWYC